MPKAWQLPQSVGGEGWDGAVQNYSHCREAGVTLGAGFHHSEIMLLALARAKEEGRGGWESRVGGSRFGQGAGAGGESSWDQRGVRLPLGCHPSCCVTSGHILAHSGSLWAVQVLCTIPKAPGPWSLLAKGKRLGLSWSFL